MTLSFGRVRRWRSAELDALAHQLRAQNAVLISMQDELGGSAKPEGWSGAAAEHAAKAHKKLVDRLEHLVAGLAATQRGVEEAADAVLGLEWAVREAEGLAESGGFVINDDGELTEFVGSFDPSGELALLRSEVEARVDQILRHAEDIDHDLSAVLGKAADGRIDDQDAPTLAAAASSGAMQGGLSVLGPPKNATPETSAGWWDALSLNEKVWALENHPGWIGNRDGIPANWRHKANMSRLDDERIKLEKRCAELQADLDHNWFGGLLTNADAEIEHVEAKLRALHDLEAALHGGDRQLLLLDTSHKDVRAAVSVGRVDVAGDVAVYVPGVGAQVDLHDLHAMLKDLNDLQVQADKLNGDRGAAVVGWIGYDIPDNLVDAVIDHGDSAREGASDLVNYLRGFNTAADDDPHLTLVGHSLGSTTAGYAMHHSTGVDDLIAAGSPGLGGDVGDLKISDGHTYVLEAKGDPIADLGVFGGDPSWFGDAAQLSTDGSPVGVVSGGHSQYFDRNTTSAFNTAAIIAGQPDKAFIR